MLYSTVGVCSLVGSALVNYFGVKLSLFIGGLGHFLFVFLSTYPAWRGECDEDGTISGCGSFLKDETLIKVSLMVSVVFNGFSAALLWVA